MPVRGSAIPFAFRTYRSSWDAPRLWLLKSLGRTVRPPPIRRKIILRFAMRRRIDISGPSNDSFIQLFELQLPKRGQICRAIGPELPSLPLPNGFTPIAVLAT